MNVSSMLDTLSFRLEDPQSRTFQEPDRLSALNDAQLLAIDALDNSFFRAELGTTQQGLLVSTGLQPACALPADIIGDRVTRISRVDNPNYAYQLCDPNDTVKFTNRYLQPTRRKPVGFIEAGNFSSLIPNDAGSQVTVSYIRTPKAMVRVNPSSGETDTCELNTVLHPLILLIAESFLWAADDESERSSIAEGKVQRYLAMLNGKGEDSDVKKAETPKR